MDPTKQMAPPPYAPPYPQGPGQQVPPYPPAGYQAPYPPAQAAYPTNYPPTAQPYYPPGPQVNYPQQPGYPQQGGGDSMQPGVPQGGYDSDAEGGNYQGQQIGGSFSDKSIRRSFIRKVYGILMCQLLVTSALVSLFMYYEPLNSYAARSRSLYWIAMVVMIVCVFAMACCESVRRTFPTNLVFLGVFTAAQGFMLGTIAAVVDSQSVLIAIGITVGVTLALTLFAFQTKYDFTTCGGMLCAMVVILMLAGFALAIFGTNRIATIGYGCAGAFIFSLYIVYDTQLMMGGKHKYALDPEEYIFASLNLYLDIVNLFLYILTIVAAGSSSD